MSFKLSEKKGGDFEIAPEGNGRAVCVDVTPLVKRQTQFGEKEEFRLVFELDIDAFGAREDGKRFVVWSRGFTPSLNEKAALRKFLKQWFGRDLNAAELSELDPESFIGKPANIVVAHETGDNDKVYANIVACTPFKGKDPLQPSGDFIRKKDREEKPGKDGAAGGAQFRKAEQPADAGRDDWQKVKVHVGKHKGVELGDLDTEAVTALAEKWLPVAEKNAKPTADDKRLIAGIKAAVAEINAAGETAAAPEPEPEY